MDTDEEEGEPGLRKMVTWIIMSALYYKIGGRDDM